jgi:hypothetical protein
MNPKVDGYLRKAKKWQEELEKLRMIMLDCQLTEELKWGKPCYTFQKSNIVVILPLKEYCALLFCKGALLNDANGILIKPGENTQAGRQILERTPEGVVIVNNRNERNSLHLKSLAPFPTHTPQDGCDRRTGHYGRFSLDVSVRCQDRLSSEGGNFQFTLVHPANPGRGKAWLRTPQPPLSWHGRSSGYRHGQ